MADQKRIAARTFSEDTCVRLIQMNSTGRQVEGTAIQGRFAQLHSECRVREGHFYNQPGYGPKFGEPFENAQVYQSDVLRKTYTEGRSRMLEHQPLIHVQPKRDIQAQRDAANALERYFQDGWRTVEERLGFRLQGHMFYGQAVLYAGVLHWRDYLNDYPEMPDLDETDEPGKKEDYQDLSIDGPLPEGSPRYREKESVRLERYKRMKAEAPFPFWFDVPRSDVCWFVEDKSLLNGMALFGTVESVGFLEYAFALDSSDGLAISINEVNNSITIFEEQERPEKYDPSGADTMAWGNLRVARIWSRSECYELVSKSDGGTWTLVKSWVHDYGMPPFVLAKAGENNHPDPLYRWYPWMLGLFRTKGQYDYERSLGRLLAEQAAIPRYWIELAPGSYDLNEDGSRRVLSESSAQAETLPPGAKLVKAQLELNPAFVQFLTMSQEDVKDATPETGFVEIGANTQPHTAVISQTQSNAPIAELKGEQARAIRVCFQSILRTLADRADDGDLTYVLGDNDKVLELDGDMLRAMTVEVKIEPNSGAQQISTNEYLRGLLHDPKTMMTTRRYLEETGEDDADAVIDSWVSEQAEFSMVPQIIQQELAKAYGDVYAITPGGTPVGMDGAAADPWKVLIAAGFQKAAPAAPPPMAAPGTAPANVPLPAAPEPMQPMNTPPAATVGSVAP